MALSRTQSCWFELGRHSCEGTLKQTFPVQVHLIFFAAFAVQMQIFASDPVDKAVSMILVHHFLLALVNSELERETLLLCQRGAAETRPLNIGLHLFLVLTILAVRNTG